MPDEESHVVGLQWEDAEDLQTVYVNHLMVSHASGDEFYLIFGEASPPTAILRGEVPEHVSIRPVVKIAVSPGSMMRMAALIEKNASTFAERTRLAQEKEDAERTH